jgi:hypothetical protein
VSRLALLVLVACGHDDLRAEEPAPSPAKPVDAAPVAADAGPAIDAVAALDAALPIDAGKPAKRLGKHNEVCKTGMPRDRPLEGGKVVLECGPGLQCCYPCGIAGCAWVCHTAAECHADMMRP